MKFAHLGDCHLGGWRFPELQELNMQSFSKAIEICIKEKVDMVLIAGDLFDSAYPSIDILKKTFGEFKKLKQSEIPCFIIAGSHDYSVSGKTFLDVLEHAGFCKNASDYTEKDGKVTLHPVISEKYAIYGYPGKKSGLEVQELKGMEIQDSPGFFKIVMLHTAIKQALGNIPIDSISIEELPKADYYALSHLHVDFAEKNVVYSGPIFPNNFEELEELNHGQFYIVNFDEFLQPVKVPIKLKDVSVIETEIQNTLTATDQIISELSNQPLEDRIILLKVKGNLSAGKVSDIRFNDIEKFAREKKAFSFIKNTSKLLIKDVNVSFEIKDIQKAEENILKDYLEKTSSKFSDKVPSMLKALGAEKQEDETNQVFNDRLIGDLKKLLNFEDAI